MVRVRFRFRFRLIPGDFVIRVRGRVGSGSCLRLIPGDFVIRVRGRVRGRVRFRFTVNSWGFFNDLDGDLGVGKCLGYKTGV